MNSVLYPTPKYRGARSASFGLALSLVSLCLCGMAYAQSGCDEGVIHLPDRNGTIQICSAMAAQVPKLSRQLVEAVRTLGSQQAQIAELSRLVRGMNNVSRGLGADRQAQMLKNLSEQLTRSQEADGGQQAIAALNDRFDDLQNRLLSAVGNQAASAAVAEAIKGSLGDAIARLDLGAASQQLKDIDARLKEIKADVGAVKLDTISIRDTLGRMETRDATRASNEAQSIALLKGISSEIKALGGRSGLIDTPKSYAERYHNARVLAQRGEVELALEAYKLALIAKVQLADPIIDIVTLLTRMYGSDGAERYIDRHFKGVLDRTSLVYAKQLLAPQQLKESYELMLSDMDTFLSFPPLGALYLRKMKDKERFTYESYPWSDWVMLTRVQQSTSRSIASGEYLAFFADQIRGGNDVEAFDQIAKYFDLGKLFSKYLQNHDGEAFQFQRRAVSLERSPVALDYTYFIENPDARRIGGSWFSTPMGREYMNKPYRRELGTFNALIWDDGLDETKPVEVCARVSGRENCVNMNTDTFKCKSAANVESQNCLRFRPSMGAGTYPPNATINLSPVKIFQATCLTRVNYTDEDGRKVSVSARGLVATYRGPGSEELRKEIAGCGYDVQIKTEVRMQQYF